jgi:Zn-finger nucleic acid-binding protein
MKCPRCETTTLDERDRDGITVDACPSCRGLWLDRGELEKLIARATRELEELSGSRPAAPEPAQHRERRDRDDDRYDRDDRYDDRRDPRYRQRKKRSVLDILGDVFD